MNRKSPTVQEGDIYEVLFVDGKPLKSEDFERDGSRANSYLFRFRENTDFWRKQKAHCNPYARTLLSFPPRK